ncbi:MAG: hypothetical protein IID31_10845 [Planctomycetes bacterium]|nr:hypothetical protein [Planctomycetota bacterium]
MTVREPNESPLGPASLLRAAADRELTPEQERLLEAHLQANPAHQAGIEFERALRSAVGRTMGQERAPAHLAERIAHAVHAVHADDSRGTRHDRKGVLPVSDSGLETQPPVVEAIAHQTRQRSFWTTLGGRMAVAAALVLAVGGLWYVSTNLGQQPVEERWSRSANVQLAGFLSGEHMKCDDPDYAADKFTARDEEEITRCCLTILDQTPRLENLFEGGATLIGLGPCKVPGPGRSVHMQVLMPVGASGAMQSTVSLFMQQSVGQAGKVAGRSFALQEAGDQEFVVDVWEKDGLIYYLVCDTAQVAEAARRSLRVIAPNQSL